MGRLQFVGIHILVPRFMREFSFWGEKKSTIALQSFERLKAQNAQANLIWAWRSQFKSKFVYLFSDEN